MIVRSAWQCETCSQPHTVRIGLGQEPSQTHRFPCRQCGEEMVLRLDADAATLRTDVTGLENATEIDEAHAAPVVNLDGNFLMPASEQGQDRSFFRMGQFRKIIDAAEARGSLKTIPAQDLFRPNRRFRPYRSPDYEAEWKLLKRAWSLHRNQKSTLSKKKVEEASLEYYGDQPLVGLPDWLFRLGSYLASPAYEQRFVAAMKLTETLVGSPRYESFLKAYATVVAPHRGKKYFDLFEEFFSNYSEYAQVLFMVTNDIKIEPDLSVTSAAFKQTRMFYGNAFEHFATLAELFAFLNNMVAGREYDQFAQLTLADYRKLDKSGRFNPFATNAEFSALCGEADNQIRNASHHGSMRYDTSSGAINYRTGKGSQGPEQTITYTAYLERCVKLFLQACTLLRLELALCARDKLPFPL